MVAQFPRLIDYMCADEDLKQVRMLWSTGAAHGMATHALPTNERTSAICVRWAARARFVTARKKLFGTCYVWLRVDGCLPNRATTVR